MANVKDLLVNGSARVIGTIYGNATSANKVNNSLTFGNKSFNGSSAQTLTLADLGGKSAQSAVSSPSASGTEISFIDTISQNANGVITATKKTVRDASTSQSGVVNTGAQSFAGEKTFTEMIYFPNVTSGLAKGIQWTVGDNDFARIRAGATGSNSGYLEIATADDANEPIYIRQYSGVFDTLNTTLTLLDNSHNTIIPNALTVGTTTSQGSSYKFYVNGTSYFNGNTTHNGIDYFANGTTYSINNSADATLRRGLFAGTSDANTAADEIFRTGALEIRESGRVGNAQSSFIFAPRIGFHWSNRIAATLSFHSDGIFYFRKQNGNDRATIDANLRGNADIATYANYLTPQEIITAINGTSRYPIGLRFGRIYSSGYPFSYGTTLTIEDGAFGAELIFNGLGGDGATGSGDMYFRTHSDWSTSEWGQWRTILDSSNYTNYTVTKTGSGASGTWGISISGNATTATEATQDSAGQQINTTYIKGLSVSGRTITYTKGDGTTGTITTQDTNTTYGVATISANGLMSSSDKSKLNGIAAGATKVTVDSSLSSTSTNPVQNKVINSALAGKAASSHTHNVSDITGLNNITLNQVYPVGSIYMSVNSTSPAKLFGGTWEQIKDMFLLACGDTYANEATGGEANHTLTVAEMPAHSHSASTNSTGSHGHSASTSSAGSHYHTGGTNTTGGHNHTEQSINVTGSYTYTGGAGSPMYSSYKTNSTSWAGDHSHSFTTTTDGNHSHSVTVNNGGSHSHTVTVNNNGSGIAHNNMPPYLAVYMWKRTA